MSASTVWLELRVLEPAFLVQVAQDDSVHSRAVRADARLVSAAEVEWGLALTPVALGLVPPDLGPHGVRLAAGAAGDWAPGATPACRRVHERFHDMSGLAGGGALSLPNELLALRVEPGGYERRVKVAIASQRVGAAPRTLGLPRDEYRA